MDSATLFAELERVARGAGLDAVGVTDVAPLTEARAAIEERKAQGLHAGMAFTYGRPERSADPGRVLDGARSIVVGALAYGTDTDGTDTDGADTDDEVTGAETGGSLRPRARIARYVRTDAYGVLRAALDRVAAWLTDRGYGAVVVMDDNRCVDRAVAYRAGLGWLGKNTMLLHPQLGSWTVLGSVVTTAELPVASAPVADGCDTCARCQRGCPTGAIDVDGVLDARRCLAWLVQQAGAFPRELRVPLGDRLYGCDECQVVCPVNESADTPVRVTGPGPRRVTAHDDPGAAVGGGPLRAASVDVLDLLGADDAEIMARVGHWFVPRRRAEYVRRNALVVLGNVADATDDRVRAALGAALRDTSDIVRAHAVWAVRRLGLDELLAGLGDDPSPLVADELSADVAVRGVAS